MTRRHSSWDALQRRWIFGETLTAAEQCARLEGALSDPRARAELALYREAGLLLERTTATDDDREFAARALAAAQPPLRLPGAAVTETSPLGLGLTGPEVLEALAALRRSKLRRAATGAAVAAAAGVALWFAVWSSRGHSDQVLSGVTESAQVAAVHCRFASEAIRVNGLDGLRSQQSCRAGDVLSTERGEGCITIDETIKVCLGQGTSVVLSSLGAALVSVEVSRGVAVAALAPRPPGATFALTSRDLSATARGTRYSLEAGPGGAARVSVFEGTVEVRTPEQRILLRPQTHLRRGNTEAHLVAGTVAVDDERRMLALLEADSLAAATSGSSEQAGSAGRPELAAATSSSPQRRASQARPAGSASRTSASNLSGDATTLFAAARREAARGNTKAALALYRELKANHGGPSTHPLLVVIGNLELDLGAPRRALASFDEYLARGGPLQQEALHGKARALRSLGRAAEEETVIRRYLAAYPNGFQAPTLRKRLASLEAR